MHLPWFHLHANQTKDLQQFALSIKKIVTRTYLLQDLRSQDLKQVKLFLSDSVAGILSALSGYVQHLYQGQNQKPRVNNERIQKAFFQRNKAQAITISREFCKYWENKYSSMIKDLQPIEPNVLTFHNYPTEIRSSIYSRNIIESFNNQINRKLKPKVSFPTESNRLILSLAV